MMRILGALVCLGVFLGMAGCGGDRPKARKKVKHDDHWHYEDEKHEETKEKAEKTEKK